MHRLNRSLTRVDPVRKSIPMYMNEIKDAFRVNGVLQPQLGKTVIVDSNSFSSPEDYIQENEDTCAGIPNFEKHFVYYRERRDYLTRLFLAVFLLVLAVKRCNTKNKKGDQL